MVKKAKKMYCTECVHRRTEHCPLNDTRWKGRRASKHTTPPEKSWCDRHPLRSFPKIHIGKSNQK